MNPNRPPAPPPPAINLQDVFYVVFRHKWLILILSLLAMAASAVLFFLSPVTYESHAQLLIKYVNAPSPATAPDERIVTPQADRGADVLSSEIQILSSMDLAEQVADIVGPAKIIGKGPSATNRLQAAAIIESGLTNFVAGKSDVITVVFSHRDPELTQTVLQSLITAFETQDKQIHSPENSDFLMGQIDSLKSKLLDTETALQDQETKAGILSLDDSKKAVADLLSKTQQDIYSTQADLAAEQAQVVQLKAALGAASPPPSNAMAASTQPTNAIAPPVPSAIMLKYQELNSLIQSLHQRSEQLRLSFTTNYYLVQDIDRQSRQAEEQRDTMETNYPGLLAVKTQLASAPGVVPSSPAADPRILLNDEISKVLALQAKLKTLTNQLAVVQTEAAAMRSVEGPIENLQRSKQLFESELAYYNQRLEASRADQAVGAANISIIESPTPPVRAASKILKMSLGVLLGGLAFAFALPFAIELYLDQNIKRPGEVQTHLGVPLFLSIPKLALNAVNGTSGKPRAALPGPVPDPNGVALQKAAPQNGAHLEIWDEGHALRPFYSALRDRLMSFFEMINLTHKPKLVAVTACAPEAGVTTTAAGLASCLSEMGDGNVLLVNMSTHHGQTQHFYKGKLARPLEDVLEKEKRAEAMLQDNLYLANDDEPGNGRLHRALPKRFSHLVSKMKASDYDYIIFDMPPVSQISITPRLARFMDMVLLVVESEKTARDAATRAAKLLAETKTNVGVVLNKSRNYLPRRFQSDI